LLALRKTLLARSSRVNETKTNTPFMACWIRSGKRYRRKQNNHFSSKL